MAEKLRVGMIGLGGIATRSHLLARPDVVIQAGAEIDLYQAGRTQQEFGILRK